MRGVFVTGTDTGIGKTLVSACLVARWGAAYWKPAQTGISTDTADRDTVATLAALSAERIHPSRHVFAAPLSVEAAATLEHATVRLSDFTLPQTSLPLVVEGAGGVLVPIAPGVLMVDLMARLALPAVLVARTSLGTINHTLLSLEAMRARGVRVAGVIFSGKPDVGNAEAIARHGNVRVLHTLPPLPEITPASVAEAAAAFPGFEEIAA